MSSKEKVLQCLRESEDFVSGAAIAKKLGLSRNSVWKAIESLRKQGFLIDAVTNRGYRLMEPEAFKEPEEEISDERIRKNSDGRTEQKEKLRADVIIRYLNPDINRKLIHVYDVVESTNKMAKELAIAGFPHGTTLIARRQTQGKAHRLKAFYSPDGGIYLSIILNPRKFRRMDPSFFSETTAVIVAESIRKICGLRTEIRNRNDIYYLNQKICGILNETGMDLDDEDFQWIVSGIGIHFSERGMDMTEENVASLYPDGNAKSSINALTAEIINQFFEEKYQNTESVRKLYDLYHA